ncbi:amino acid ABC transporter permease [Georgenia faecalis]|uniref:Amino acid ABC transporter permease n=1 Tax=Georgenia faecalis TaxID=2483799 RepID=A0ABV9DEZ4_9MICO|nr:amino acid ABC transporter permease [Georgenia faecalis]
MSADTALYDVLGPRGRRRIRVVNIVGAVVVLAVAAWVVWALAGKGQLTAAKWSPFLTADVWEFYLLPGLRVTFTAAFWGILGAITFGLLFGLGRLATFGPLRWACAAVVEFFRAVPVLIMMIFLYFALSRSGIIAPGDAPLYAVIIALALYNGSVIAELVRSGVHSLPSGQREAARALGLRHGQSLWSVELPQALIAMLPSLLSQLVVILKDTALGYIITSPELLRQARLVGSSYANLLPALIVAAAIFIVVNFALTWVAGRLARRLSSRTAGRTAPQHGGDAEGRAEPVAAAPVGTRR